MDNNFNCTEQDPLIPLTETNLKTNHFKCEHCKETFLNENDLHMHYRLHEGKYFKCSLCDKHFSELNELKSHDLFHSLEEAAEDVSTSFLDVFTFNDASFCSICHEAFENDEQLITHNTANHADELTIINTIPQTEKASDFIENNISANRTSECFETNLDLSKTPIIDLELQEENLISSCGICGKDFKNTNQLNKHLSDHAKNKDLICSICGKKFTRTSYLKKHLSLHQRPILSCKICGLCFPQERLTEHVMQFHDPKRKFVCTVCEKRFFLRNDLKRHLDAHVGNKSFVCEICNRKFVHKSDRTRHMRNHLGLKPFQCTVCKKRFDRNFHLQKHSALHKVNDNCTMKPAIHYVNQENVTGGNASTAMPIAEKNLCICYVCNETHKESNFSSHFATKHKNLEVNQCHLCSMQFTEYSKVIEHIAWHKGEKMPFTHKKLEICHVCNRKFSKKLFLEKHFVVAHKGIKVDQCHICFKKIPDNLMMLKHVLSHKNMKKIKCKLCPKSFLSQSSLQKHLVLHRKKKELYCEVCKVKFTSIASLKIHSLTHKKNEVLNCEVCNKVFSSKKLLGLHFKVHRVGLPKNSCVFCHRVFSNPANVKRHINSIHKGLKRHQCFECGKKYARRDHLTIHESIHLRRKFPCNICSQVFTFKTALQNHIAVHEEVKKFERSYNTRKKTTLTDSKSKKRNKDPRITPNSNGNSSTGLSKSKIFKKINPESSNNISGTKIASDVAKKNSQFIEKESDGKTVDKNKFAKQNKEVGVYPCDQCKKCFKKEYVLRKHMKVWHPVIMEDYTCDQCGETFQEKFNLDVHKISHEGISLSHKCENCDSTFVRKSLLTNHIKKVHKD